jgi:two-component system sensor histidine kinase PilS (NtrC family)
MQSTFDERNWLAWLVKVRILILSFLLAIQWIVAHLTLAPLPLRLFVSTILLWFGLSLFHALLLSYSRHHRRQALLQVLTDLVFISLVVHETGGWDSSLNFLYALAIIVASILLPRVWAQLVAVLAFVLYGTVLELNYFGMISSYCTTHPTWKALQAIIFVNLFAYIAIAYLGGLLNAKLRQARVQLKDTSGALENLQVLHENIIQSIGSGLITTGLDGHVTLANSAAQKLLEYAPEQLLGTQVGKLFHDPLPNAESPQAHAEVRFVTANSFRKTLRVRVAALHVPERGAVGYLYVLDDLTEIRRLEREVRVQDRLAAVGRLAAATDFLAYSRVKRYRFEKVDLVQLLEDTTTLMRHRMTSENAAIHIESHYEVPEAWALADGDRIKQVFWNFGENAVRAMENGGTLRVSLERYGEDWQIGFADTGTGMTPQQSEKIFEPFQSSFEGGTGLGLALVYQIVQAHEGKVWARSKLGQGTTFILRLRRFEAETSPVLNPPSADKDPGPAQLAAAAGEGRRRG